MSAGTLEARDISKVAGNAPDHIKAVVSNTSRYYLPGRNLKVNGPIFGASITKRLEVTEVSVLQKAEEPSKTEGRMVCELTVEEATTGDYEYSVSQSLNIVYHSPAGL
ncbi:hypothetical protein C0993_004613 [Termitomyces sp. T159_Od127]|nr:hypothetical protein C0993_004613 [Termitomyces sp. T159_Od127]